MKELRSLPHRVSLGLSGGGRGGGGPRIGWFFRLSPIWSCCQRRLFWARFRVLLGKWLFRRPKEKQASSDAADAGRMLMLVSWPRCACASSILALDSRRAATCLSVCLCLAKSWYVGSKPASPVAVFVWQGVNMLDQNCSY